MSLIAVSCCPVCGSVERVPAPDGMARFKKDAGYHYLKHAAAALEITVEQLVYAGKQHQYAFDERFLKWLSTVLETADDRHQCSVSRNAFDIGA